MNKDLNTKNKHEFPPDKKTEFSPSEEYQKATKLYSEGKFEEAEIICKKILNSGPHGDSYNMLAHIAHTKGEHEKSISLMHKALQLYKTSPTYNNNLGNLLFKQGNYDSAKEFFQKTIRFKPDFAEAHFNLGLAEVKCGNHEQALPSFEKTIQLRPDICDAYTNIGNIYMKLNRKKEAEAIYRKALDLRPGDIIISVNLSLALQRLQEWKPAEEILLEALADSPGSPEVLFNLGNIYQTTNKSGKAIECYKSALKTAQNDPKILYNLGTTFMESDQYADALTCFKKTLDQSPGKLQALNNMGMVHYKIGDYQNALNYYQKAIDLQPDFAEAHNNIGLVYKVLEQKEKSMFHFHQAIKADSEFGEAFHNLAEVQRESKLFDEAAENSRRAIELQPDLTPAYTHHAYLLKWLCEWNEYEQVKDHLDFLVTKELAKGKTVRETPFMNLIRVDDPLYNRKIADHFAQNVFERSKNFNLDFSFRHHAANHKKITVGYLSSNFRYHPLAHLLANLFKHHNRNEFQINCYSMGPDDGSEYRKRFMEDSNIFRDIRDLTHAESAQKIFDDKVDILVDLMGYTQGNRLEIAALRPAPLQVRYMGMPGTTGGTLFDYIIVDEIVLPRNQQDHYAEKFIYMPHTYQINDKTKKISKKTFTRRMFNLPEDAFVFCSFNTSYKIDPVVFSLWMEILHKTKNSVLWLMPDTTRAGDNMRELAVQNGISPERLIYAHNIPLEEHLARIGLADLALDTLTVGGAATTSDALWGGTPIITLPGNRFISRMSASILSAIGLNELVTNTPEEYKKLAIRLAENRETLDRLKQKLKRNITSMPLFDTLGFTLNLEKAFKKIWKRHVAGMPPETIDLKKNIQQLSGAPGLYLHEYNFPLERISMN